jgi:sec-independent protein translocase protein TatB
VFDSVGWGKILVLIVAGLFILGPERLPDAAAWVAKSIRKVREFATGAQEQLRKPLEDLRRLRNFDPKQVVTQHLFDGDSDPLGLSASNGADGDNKPNGFAGTSAPQAKPQPEPLKPGEKPPIDPDAT